MVESGIVHAMFCCRKRGAGRRSGCAYDWRIVWDEIPLDWGYIETCSATYLLAAADS